MEELAGQYGFKFVTAKASIDESALGNRRSHPGELVKLLAKAKAEAIIEKLATSEGYLLTSDQVNHCIQVHTLRYLGMHLHV